ATDAGPAPLCADGDLLVTPTTDAATYAIGSAPVLTVTIKNASQAVCRRAVGPGAVELIVTSGSDRIWSSQDCAPGGPQELTTLRPGDQRAVRVTWAGHRSAPGCSGPKAAVQPGTYRLTAQVGTLRQLGATFHVA
ncbi:MAG: hypothetical protein M3N21_08260, partial [Actinomycetota bacterium]|nr:hypothetical protein [Actinomycetota bacterium]